MTVTIKKKRISADLDSDGKPTTTLVQYILFQDGRRIDSFLSKERAERRAAELNGESGEVAA